MYTWMWQKVYTIKCTLKTEWLPAQTHECRPLQVPKHSLFEKLQTTSIIQSSFQLCLWSSETKQDRFLQLAVQRWSHQPLIRRLEVQCVLKEPHIAPSGAARALAAVLPLDNRTALTLETEASGGKNRFSLQEILFMVLFTVLMFQRMESL